MKNFIINKSMNYIKKRTDYDEVKLCEIKYGLEGLYLTYSKLIIIFLFGFLLNFEQQILIYLIVYNIIRLPSFGLHATKSWVCLVSSTMLFIGIPYLCMFLSIPINLKIIIGVLGTCLMIKNSPADTKKKPIVNKKRRNIYKLISTIIACLFWIISVLIKNNFISNCFMFAIIMQNFMISPLVYKIFKLPYNNYINFLKEHPEFQR